MVAALALLLLVFAGYVKGAPVVSAAPIDITFVGAGVVALTVVHRLLSTRFILPSGTALVVFLWLAFLIGVPFANFDDLGIEKTVKLYSLSLLSLFGAMVLFQDVRTRAWWLKFNVALGVMVLALSILFPNEEVIGQSRLAVEGSNTIGAGRAIGAAAVILILASLTTRRGRIILIVAGLILGAATLVTGSRGPALAILVATLAAAAFGPSRSRGTRIALSAGALGVATYLAFGAQLVSSRLFSLADNSAETRRELWGESLALIASRPFGVGWGQLADNVPIGLMPREGGRLYSHNIFLEVTVEAGWIAGMVLVVTVAVAFRRQIAVAADGAESVLLGLLLFHLVNAMVSGDVVDNRGLWSSIGVGLVAFDRMRTEGSFSKHLKQPRLGGPTARRGCTWPKRSNASHRRKDRSSANVNIGYLPSSIW